MSEPAPEAPRLTHLDEGGAARMVDVGEKAVTRRIATAAGRLATTSEVIALIRGGAAPKGDVLATARLAGIAAAKRTDELIPLAHSLPLDAVDVAFELEDRAVGITATASATGRTGVEMEALTAVAVAGLTLHDMVKAVDPRAVLGEIRLLEKRGGRHGHWTRRPEAVELAAAVETVETVETSPSPAPAVVIVASTRAAAGARQDTTGPLIASWLAARGFTLGEPRVVADADVAAALAAAFAERPAVILTTGGTGASPTDRTPEATRALLDRELPGVAETIRAAGCASTPTAALSRAVAGVAGGTVIVNLPGSPGGVRDGLAVLDGLLPHLLDQLAGHDH